MCQKCFKICPNGVAQTKTFKRTHYPNHFRIIQFLKNGNIDIAYLKRVLHHWIYVKI